MKTPPDVEAIEHALDNYLAKIQAEDIPHKYIKNADKWFRDWRDYVDVGPPPRRMPKFTV